MYTTLVRRLIQSLLMSIVLEMQQMDIRLHIFYTATQNDEIYKDRKSVV